MAKLESLPLRLRLSNVLTAYVRYIGGMIWPFRPDDVLSLRDERGPDLLDLRGRWRPRCCW